MFLKKNEVPKQSKAFISQFIDLLFQMSKFAVAGSEIIRVNNLKTTEAQQKDGSFFIPMRDKTDVFVKIGQ